MHDVVAALATLLGGLGTLWAVRRKRTKGYFFFSPQMRARLYVSLRSHERYRGQSIEPPTFPDDDEDTKP